MSRRKFRTERVNFIFNDFMEEIGSLGSVLSSLKWQNILPSLCTLQHVGQAADRGKCSIKAECLAESGQRVEGVCSKGRRVRIPRV